MLSFFCSNKNKKDVENSAHLDDFLDGLNQFALSDLIGIHDHDESSIICSGREKSVSLVREEPLPEKHT